ncbi:hypothetical protein VQH23_16145 [Pararoseomonas sp. SCSIO 73927]|uniref:hypothetical protein n=1 Tax=Pararoseomonas sp. SCSIO 73927 TaxID=3114537 RepID=UPI0030D51E76
MPRAKEVAAAPAVEQRVQPGQFDPRPLLEAIERDLPGATTVEAIFGLLHRLDGIDTQQPARGSWGVTDEEAQPWVDRWIAVENVLKARLAAIAVPLSPGHMADALAFVIEDQHRSPGVYSSDDATFAIARRVEHELRAQADATADDAEGIRVCDGHAAFIAAMNERGSGRDDCPHWLAYARSRDAVTNFEPRSQAGFAAKARAARAEMRDPDGSYQLNGTIAESWAKDIVLFIGTDQVGSLRPLPPCPAAALLPDFIQADCAEEAWSTKMAETLHEKLASQVAGARMDALWRLLPTVRPRSPAGAFLCLAGASRLVSDVEDFEHPREEISRMLEEARTLLSGAYYIFAALHATGGAERFCNHYLGMYRYPHATPDEHAAAMSQVSAT